MLLSYSIVEYWQSKNVTGQLQRKFFPVVMRTIFCYVLMCNFFWESSFVTSMYQKCALNYCKRNYFIQYIGFYIGYQISICFQQYMSIISAMLLQSMSFSNAYKSVALFYFPYFNFERPQRARMGLFKLWNPFNFSF